MPEYVLISAPITLALVLLLIRRAAFVAPRIGLLPWLRRVSIHESRSCPDGTAAILRLSLQNAEHLPLTTPVEIRTCCSGVERERVTVAGYHAPTDRVSIYWDQEDLVIKPRMLGVLKTMVFDVYLPTDRACSGQLRYDHSLGEPKRLWTSLMTAGSGRGYHWHTSAAERAATWTGLRSTALSVTLYSLGTGLVLYTLWTQTATGLWDMHWKEFFRGEELSTLFGELWEGYMLAALAGLFSIVMFIAAEPPSPPTAQGYRQRRSLLEAGRTVVSTPWQELPERNE